MDVRTSIDYLTLTSKDITNEPHYMFSSEQAAAWAEFRLWGIGIECDIGHWKPLTPTRFYKYAFEVMKGVRVDIAEDTTKQGIKVMISGSAKASGVDMLAVLRDVSYGGWNITRMDIAMDIIGEEVGVIDIALKYWEKHGHVGRKQSKLHTGKAGEMFTVGSRTSVNYVRVYDKAKEQGLTEKWLRVEGELKGYAALQAVPHIIKDVRAANMKILGHLDLNGWQWFDDLVITASCMNPTDWKKPPSVNGGLKWWNDQVKPAYRKLLLSDATAALEVYEALGELILQHLTNNE